MVINTKPFALLKKYIEINDWKIENYSKINYSYCKKKRGA
jgi:hypothetical protein